MKNPNKRSAFTVAELVITMIVLAFLVFILLGFMNRDRQKEFDAKINKTSANLSGVVNKALLQKTGQYGADSQITPQEIYTDLIQGKDVFNIVETCIDNSCWGEELIGGENLVGKTKIVLNDGTAIAFGEIDIFIDANGLKKPNVMGKDVRKWNGEYRRPDVVKTTAVCAAPREEHNSLCCEPLGANEVWTSTSGCDTCEINKWRNNTCCYWYFLCVNLIMHGILSYKALSRICSSLCSDKPKVKAAMPQKANR